MTSGLVQLLLDRRTRRAFFALWCCGWLLVGLMSLRPVDVGSGTDKVMHFTGYAIMAATAAGFCHRVSSLMACAVLASVAGLAFEGLQGLVPYRSAEPLDALANAAGAAAGCAIACAWIGRVVRPLCRPRASRA